MVAKIQRRCQRQRKKLLREFLGDKACVPGVKVETLSTALLAGPHGIAAGNFEANVRVAGAAGHRQVDRGR